MDSGPMALETANAVTAQVTLKVNGQQHHLELEPRVSLLDALREQLHLTGSKKGCNQGACGACTVLCDGERVLSCLSLAIQYEGTEITTIEGLAEGEDQLSPVQRAFREFHGLQCGFCTPGFIMSVTSFLRDNPDPTEEELRDGLSGNLCRCTGYQGIIKAAKSAAAEIRQQQADSPWE